MKIVDAQVHIWKADMPDRPWPAERSAGNHGESLSAETMLQWMDEAGVDRAMIVPPSWEGDRNDYALSAAASYPDRFAVMGRIPIVAPVNSSVFADWKKQPGMLGMRFTFHDDRNKKRLKEGDVDWIWPLAEEAGIPLMVNVPGSVEVIERVAQRYPDLKLVIDHLACWANKKDEEAYVDTDALIRLSRLDNVAVKASAIARYTTEVYPYTKTQERLKRIFEAFGAKRFFWGSDISRLPCTYQRSVALFTEEANWLSQDDKEWVMGLGICQWLDWKS